MIGTVGRMAGLILLVWVGLKGSICAAQPAYPQHDFRNPLGIPISLAGNFGECRPNHFHSGIDIKTEGRENLPVYAAADGYVSRVKTEPGGFGHALYVTHPNGFTTLYAHLNDFNPALQAFLRNEQYARESWTVDLPLQPDQFPLRQGDQIAWSGNTGGSTAPHLHFEIRDTKSEHPLNPQLFGLPVKDTRPPVPQCLAIYDARRSIHLQKPVYYPLVRRGKGWVISRPLSAPARKVLIGVVADDFMEGSDNTLNFYTAAWYIDGALQGRIRLDDIGYDVTRYLHAYIDYAARVRDDRWVQLLTRLPGNALAHIYDSLNADRGAISLPDRLPHALRIILRDAAGNETEIAGSIAANPAPEPGACNPAYQPGQSWDYYHTNLRLSIPADALYDAVCFPDSQPMQPGPISGIFSVGDPLVPVHRYFPLRIMPGRPIPFALRTKLALRYSDGKKEQGQAATFDDNGWYRADVRAFGSYWLAADTAAPMIKLTTPKAALGKAPRLEWDISDALTSVKKARAELDGKWVLLEQHGSRWFYEVDGHFPAGRHRIVIKAWDENGNEAEWKTDIVRG